MEACALPADLVADIVCRVFSCGLYGISSGPGAWSARPPALCRDVTRAMRDVRDASCSTVRATALVRKGGGIARVPCRLPCQLVTLDVSWSSVADLSPLSAGCPHLRDLRMQHTRVQSIQPLAQGNARLKTLMMGHTPVRDLTPLSGACGDLQVLYLEGLAAQVGPWLRGATALCALALHNGTEMARDCLPPSLEWLSVDADELQAHPQLPRLARLRCICAYARRDTTCCIAGIMDSIGPRILSGAVTLRIM